MRSLLVTVRGPEGEEDLVAPADVPVSAVVGALVEAATTVRAGEPGEWELALPGRTPLSSARSLEEQGISDGAIVQIRPRASGEGIDRGAGDPLPDEGELLPLERARALLPPRSGPVARLRDAAVAARGPGAGASRLSRAGHSWRQSRYLRRLSGRIGAPRLDRCATIAVCSAGPGSGASTIVSLLATLLAAERRSRVVSLDPVRAPELPDLSGPDRRAARTLDATLQRRPDGLLALPTIPAGRNGDRPDGTDLESPAATLARLKSLCGLIVLDCGALESPSAHEAVALADQAVLVFGPGPAEDTPASSRQTIAELELPFVAVLNRQRRVAPRPRPESFQRLIPAARGLVTVHEDRVLARRIDSGAFSWAGSKTGGTWARSIRELACLLAAGWPALALSGGEAESALESELRVEGAPAAPGPAAAPGP